MGNPLRRSEPVGDAPTTEANSAVSGETRGNSGNATMSPGRQRVEAPTPARHGSASSMDSKQKVDTRKSRKVREKTVSDLTAVVTISSDVLSTTCQKRSMKYCAHMLCRCLAAPVPAVPVSKALHRPNHDIKPEVNGAQRSTHTEQLC